MRLYRMHTKIGNRQVEYMDLIDLMYYPSNMDIGLSSFKIVINNKQTYDLTDYLMGNLETIIALASMTCIVELDAYELHLEDEKVFNNFINECQGVTLYI